MPESSAGTSAPSALRGADAGDQVAGQSVGLSLQAPLGRLIGRELVHCGADATLQEALSRMHALDVGSMLVTGATGQPLGILTRRDILGRITLAEVPLTSPISAVMTQPVHALTDEHTALDASLLMAARAIRHIPVTRGGAAVGLVSEHDLFALDRLSLQQLGARIRAARDAAALQPAAHDIRRLARQLLVQGVHARQLTALISHLNDLLTVRLIELEAARHGVDLSRVCWVALGSEGRSEQTISTDQDNALILDNRSTDAERARLLQFGRAVNGGLDACGFPLCRGDIMAGEAACCVTLGEWQARFERWIAYGAPQDLLQASIYFDFRPLAGDVSMAQALRREVLDKAQAAPRFIKQLAMNALQHAPPLNWAGRITSDSEGLIDLKLQGAAIYVDAARIYALAQGVDATSTRGRLEAVGSALGLPPAEYESWVSGFEFLQTLRLRLQLAGEEPPIRPNHLKMASLTNIDKRVLKESFRQARALQQRLQMDYER